MIKLIRACAIACSMYSKIPMPQFAWEEDDFQYALCFFPLVGAVIGLCVVGWGWLCARQQIGTFAYVMISAAIPLVVTGGFHVDGFMDTMDALHSYQSRERKLEILKDSHIGAFSVIMLLLYYLVYLAAFSEIRNVPALRIVGLGFVLSRIFSGIGVVVLQPAKKDGLLRTFSDGAKKKTVFWTLLAELVFCVGGMLAVSRRIGIFVFLGAAGSFLWYRYRSYREFGGITGDTAGYFLLLCEAAVVVTAAAVSR